jgi:hypothetical protein
MDFWDGPYVCLGVGGYGEGAEEEVSQGAEDGLRGCRDQRPGRAEEVQGSPTLGHLRSLGSIHRQGNPANWVSTGAPKLSFVP